MTDIGIAIFVLWASIAGLLYGTNRDLLSPAKMLHIFLLLFFVGIFYRVETVSVYLTYIVLLLASAFIGFFEALSLKTVDISFTERLSLSFTNKQVNRLIILLWLGSLIPIFAQLYMIVSFGGFFNFLIALTWRVKEFGGWGPVIMIIKLIFIINLLYFIILFLSKAPTKTAISFFIIHCTIIIGMGLLTGSRGVVLGNFLAMLIISNYWGKPVSLKFVMVVGIVLFGTATVLDQIRSGGLSIGEGSVSLNNSRASQAFEMQAKKSTTLNAGLNPISLVYKQNVDDMQYGLTFLSALTNLIPSAFWDEKPRSGGLVLTQDYMGDAWGGYSNITTGILTEFILNIGLGPGLLLGVAFLLLVFAFFNKYYVQTRDRQVGIFGFKSIFMIVSYVIFFRSITSLPVAEFTNIVINIIIQLVSLVMILILLKIFLATLDLTNKTKKRVSY